MRTAAENAKRGVWTWTLSLGVCRVAAEIGPSESRRERGRLSRCVACLWSLLVGLLQGGEAIGYAGLFAFAVPLKNPYSDLQIIDPGTGWRSSIRAAGEQPGDGGPGVADPVRLVRAVSVW